MIHQQTPRGTFPRHRLPEELRPRRAKRSAARWGLGAAIRMVLAGLSAAVLSGCGGPVPEEVYYEARKAFDAVDYANAERGFVEYVTSYPKHEYVPPAYYFLGVARARQGDSTGAIEAFREAEQRSLEPQLRVEAQVYLASLYREREEWDAALGKLRALVEGTAGATQKNFALELAQTLRRAGRIEAASAYLWERSAGAADPRFRGEYLLSAADLYWATPTIDRTLAALDAIVEDASLAPDIRVRGYMWRGRALEQAGRTDEAAVNYQELRDAFAGTVDGAEADVALAALFQEKDPARAETHLRQATEEFSRLIETATESAERRTVLRARIAEAYARLKRHEEAIAAYEEIQRLNPDDHQIQESVTIRLQQLRDAYRRDSVVKEAIPATRPSGSGGTR